MASSDGNMPEISPHELVFEDKIGEGSYGQVYAGKCRGKTVAIKIFKPGMFQSDEEMQAIREEVRIMSKIFHPNVVLFMGACTLEVTEKMPTDLESLLLGEDRKQLSLFRRMKMAKDAVLGMNWLHGSDPVFIHRDLKLSNLLVDNSYKVCVCDFGLAQTKPRDVAQLEYDPHGSPLYMAPEVFIGDYNEKCDIYSFGIVLWEIYTEQQAFEDVEDNLPAFIHEVCDNNFRPIIPDDCLPSVRALIETCWQKDPRRRPSFEQIIPMMDAIIVDAAVSDPTAAQMWKEEWPGHDEVEWDVFRDKLCDRLGLPHPSPEDVRFRCLHAVLVSDSSEVVSRGQVVNIERLGQVCAWFGPMFDGEDPECMLGRIEDMLKQRWFHGSVGTVDAEDRLQGKPKGTFLVRFSSSAPGCFTISHLNRQKEMTHQRVTHIPGEGFYFWDVHYPDFKELLRDQRKKQYFVEPCEGSPYQRLFPKKKSGKKAGKPAPSGPAAYASAPPARR